MNRGLRNRRLRVREEIDPLQGAINIVDAMLVFACGLMLSLIIHWNVDLGETGQRVGLQPGREVAQTPDMVDNLIESQDEGKMYEKMGTVYKDPATGKLFMLTDK
ncbi:DUF2149 domain-containing protein [Petroclostridium sp. X23]|uniref:DUF2149 domain-containing protein n=1 Tax=Petroclostridium sp. X23 TaxID=3045146 RepID=UPI0024AC89FC|nr:DUF2149 domain-containing protein [Petroclostridium sp. X23]WHH57770.1 DUF2149 domain-containing protein [Petroclostridium sp. X23]